MPFPAIDWAVIKTPLAPLAPKQILSIKEFIQIHISNFEGLDLSRYKDSIKDSILTLKGPITVITPYGPLLRVILKVALSGALAAMTFLLCLKSETRNARNANAANDEKVLFYSVIASVAIGALAFYGMSQLPHIPGLTTGKITMYTTEMGGLGLASGNIIVDGLLDAFSAVAL